MRTKQKDSYLDNYLKKINKMQEIRKEKDELLNYEVEIKKQKHANKDLRLKEMKK